MIIVEKEKKISCFICGKEFPENKFIFLDNSKIAICPICAAEECD